VSSHLQMQAGESLERLHDACASGVLADVNAALATHGESAATAFSDPDDDGQTALHHACVSGSLPVVQFVLDRTPPGSCNTRDNHDMSPFHLACENGHLALVQLLVARPDLDRNLRSSKRTSFFLASKHAFSEICTLLERLEKEDAEKERG
jgi:ankyrin repeat protein